MPPTLQKPPPTPGNAQRAPDQSPSRTPPGGDHSRRHSQAYAIDIVQTLRVSSGEPLTRRTIDAVKKSLGKLGDRGTVSDDDAGAGVRVVQTGMEVVTGKGSGAKPSPPPRPHTASPGGSGKQKQDHPKQPPKRILFYHVNDPYYGFTNFSPDPVDYRGKRYPTSEHLFQSLKVRNTTRRMGSM